MHKPVRLFIPSSLLLFLLTPSFGQQPDKQCLDIVAKLPFCGGPHAVMGLCSYMPREVPTQAGYGDFACTTQVPFDFFSWQNLVALNWPADSKGQPCDAKRPGCLYTSITTAPDLAPRVWDYYKSKEDLIPASGKAPNADFLAAPEAPPPPCAGGPQTRDGMPVRVIRMISKADDDAISDFGQPGTNLPLIDRSLNYVLYEVRVNDVYYNYVISNKLYLKSVQEKMNVNFPAGSIEVKAGWRLLDPNNKAELARYFTRHFDIYVSKEHSQTGQAFCVQNATLGLVAVHIVHKTDAHPQWIWSSFEQAQNAPQGQATTCAAPSGKTQYAFFNPNCVSGGKPCQPNQPPPIQKGKQYTWAPTPPYAIKFATGNTYGTQVVRCLPIELSAPPTNTRWRAISPLKTTVWRNYELLGSQWAFKPDNPKPPPPSKTCLVLGTNKLSCGPMDELNSVQETYLQAQVSQTVGTNPANGCIQCHALAVDAVKKQSDFSFQLKRAK